MRRLVPSSKRGQLVRKIEGPSPESMLSAAQLRNRRIERYEISARLARVDRLSGYGADDNRPTPHLPLGSVSVDFALGPAIACGGLPPPSPPAEKATASKDQTGKASTRRVN